MFTTTLKDNSWSLEIESEIQIAANDPHILSVMQFTCAMHSQSHISKISFNSTNKVFKIEFVDGRIWKMKILNQTSNSEVTYQIPENDKWLRLFIYNYITPLINHVMDLIGDHKMSKLTINYLL